MRGIPLTTGNQRSGRMSESHATNWSLDWLYQQLEEKEFIINGISDALMLLDVDSYEILDVNQALFNLYKVSRDKVIGKTCHEITHHLPQPCSKISDLDPYPPEKSISRGYLGCWSERISLGESRARGWGRS
jgi:PAS domain-containing protein